MFVQTPGFYADKIWWEMIVDLSNGLHEQIVHIQTPGYYTDKMNDDVSSDSYALKLQSLVPLHLSLFHHLPQTVEGQTVLSPLATQ